MSKNRPINAAPQSGWKTILKRSWPTIRILLSIALLWKATSGIDWHALFTTELKMQPMWFIGAILAIFSAFTCGGIRWALLMRKVGFQGSVFAYIKLYFAGTLINQGLPSTLGGDSYRAVTGSHLTADDKVGGKKELDEELHHEVDLGHATPKLRLGFAMTLIDRMLGLAGNNLLGGIGLVLGGATLASWGVELGYGVIAIMLFAGIVGALILIWEPSLRLLEKILARFRMMATLPGIRFAFGFPTTIAQVTFSIGIHCFNIIALGCCLKAYGAAVPVEALMIGLPALSLLLMLPISISGWGLREATLSSVLVLWGVEPSLTVLASVSFGAFSALCALPGVYPILKLK